MFQQVSFCITWVSKAPTHIRVGCHKKETHLPPALIVVLVVCPRVPRLNIGRNDDATGVPQPHPRELEPSELSCATLAIPLAARHFDQRREQFRFTSSEADKRTVPSLDCVRPTCVCSQVLALPCQHLHLPLELQECRCVVDIGLRDVNAR